MSKWVKKFYDRVSRAVFLVSYMVIMLIVSAFVTWGTIWGVILWAVVMAITIENFLVSVPEVTGLVTVDLFTGELQTYGPGMSLRYPSEQVKAGNYINLRLETKKPVTESYPSADGPLMLVKWAFQYRPLLDHLDKYISADASTINEGIEEVGSSILSMKIGGLPSEECKKQQHEIEKGLIDAFDAMTPKPKDLYGIELVRVSLADVDFEASVQAARASEEINRKIKKMAAEVKKDHPELTDKEAWNMALVVTKNATKEIFEVEGDAGKALSALIIAAARGKGGK